MPEGARRVAVALCRRRAHGRVPAVCLLLHRPRARRAEDGEIRRIVSAVPGRPRRIERRPPAARRAAPSSANVRPINRQNPNELVTETVATPESALIDTDGSRLHTPLFAR